MTKCEEYERLHFDDCFFVHPGKATPRWRGKKKARLEVFDKENKEARH